MVTDEGFHAPPRASAFLVMATVCTSLHRVDVSKLSSGAEVKKMSSKGLPLVPFPMQCVYMAHWNDARKL